MKVTALIHPDYRVDPLRQNHAGTPFFLLLLLSWCFTSTETTRLIRDGVGNEGPGPPPCSHSSRPLICWNFFLSWCFTSTETIWLIGDLGIVG